MIIMMVNFSLKADDFYGYSKIIFGITKILMMPILMFGLRNPKNRSGLWYFLLFSWFGDIVLLFRPIIFSVLGMGFFSTAHVFNIIRMSKYGFPTTLKSVLLSIIPLPLILFKLVPAVLKSEPVYHSALGYLVLLMIALFFGAKGDQKGSMFSFIGYLFFVVSDCVLLYNESQHTLTGKPNAIVLLTYAIAQYLILKSDK